MGWLLGCFKCTGKIDGAKEKKQFSGVGSSVPGRSNSAAVAHAISPEDFHSVRTLPSDLTAASSKECIEKEPNDSSLLPLQDQIRTRKSARRLARQDEDRVWPHENDMHGELESFKERLMQDAGTAKQLSDEVKFLRGCHSLLESPLNTFKVTFDKSGQDVVEQVDYGQHSWLVSSVVTRIQPAGGPLIDACSPPSSPLLDLCDTGSLHSRGKHASHSNSFDNLGDNNPLKCAELSLFRVESGVCDAFVDGICESLQTARFKSSCETGSLLSEHNVPSPPWTFSAEKENETSSHDFEASDDLLLGHLDVSSLIEDSALITNWELSSDSSFPGTLGLNGGLQQVTSQEERRLPLKSESLDCAKQEQSDIISDGSSNYVPIVVPEVHSESKLGLSMCCFEDETSCCSNGIPSEANFSHGGHKGAGEESNGDSTSQSCFSSQFRLAKCVWISTWKNLPEKESDMGDHLQHNYSDEAHEVTLPDTQPKVELSQESRNGEDEHHPLLGTTSESSVIPNDNVIGHGEPKMDCNILSLSSSSWQVQVSQDTAEDFPLENTTDLMMNKIPSFAVPAEEQDGEQRKKIKIGDSSVSENVRESMLIEEDDQVPLLDAAAFEDGHESSLEVRQGNLSEDSTASECVTDEHALKKTPVLSFTFSSLSSPQAGTPPSVSSRCTPARLVDDRPILGTVAAHWSPITTRKWWDGKGIPNSTNKYQEDQKVNWHAIPFEVRLEQALAKQDIVSSM